MPPESLMRREEWKKEWRKDSHSLPTSVNRAFWSASINGHRASTGGNSENEEIRTGIENYYSGLYGAYIESEKKGYAKVKAEIARNMLAMGMSWSQIIQVTELTEEELKPLQK